MASGGDGSFSTRYPLHAAARAGDVEQVLKIIMQQQQQQQSDLGVELSGTVSSSSSDIDERDQHRRTAAHLAAFEGHDHVLTALIR